VENILSTSPTREIDMKKYEKDYYISSPIVAINVATEAGLPGMY